MTTQSIPGLPVIPIGAAHRQGIPTLGAHGTVTLDAALEACIFHGRIFIADDSAHTLDTTGSSAIEWRTSTTTFANGTTTVTVGLAAMDAATGPAARAANVADAITFDVGVTYTGGGGGITTAAWQTSVPTAGSKSVSNGDYIAMAVQMVTRGGADSVLVSYGSQVVAQGHPGTTSFTGAAYANASGSPVCVITFSDGVKGYFVGGMVASIGSTAITWNSGSGTKEYGNLLQFNVPVRIGGIAAGLTLTADADLVLYSDPLGTPVAQRTINLDGNVTATASGAPYYEYFKASEGGYYDLAANTPVGVIAKPGASNLVMAHITMNASGHQDAWVGTGYAINRASGAFAAQNSSKDRFAIGLILSGFSDGAGGGSGLMFNPSLEGL